MGDKVWLVMLVNNYDGDTVSSAHQTYVSARLYAMLMSEKYPLDEFYIDQFILED